jgi:hypothetical protein
MWIWNWVLKAISVDPTEKRIVDIGWEWSEPSQIEMEMAEIKD